MRKAITFAMTNFLKKYVDSRKSKQRFWFYFLDGLDNL